MRIIGEQLREVFKPLPIPHEIRLESNRVPVTEARIVRKFLNHMHEADMEVLRENRVRVSFLSLFTTGIFCNAFSQV